MVFLDILLFTSLLFSFPFERLIIARFLFMMLEWDKKYLSKIYGYEYDNLGKLQPQSDLPMPCFNGLRKMSFIYNSSLNIC